MCLEIDLLKGTDGKFVEMRRKFCLFFFLEGKVYFVVVVLLEVNVNKTQCICCVFTQIEL